jgi:hypothetical protein
MVGLFGSIGGAGFANKAVVENLGVIIDNA